MSLFGLLAAAYAVSVVSGPGARRPGAGPRLVLAGAGQPHPLAAEPSAARRASAPRALLVATGLGAGVTDALRTHDAGAVGTVLGAALAQWPAVLAVAGFAAVLFAAVPTLTAASWGLLGFFGVLTLIAPSLDVGQAVLDLSPFNHVPKLPAASATATQLIVLSALSLVLLAGTVAAFRRRDLVP
jgi:ABC-2 type transport system permease protein